VCGFTLEYKNGMHPWQHARLLCSPGCLGRQAELLGPARPYTRKEALFAGTLSALSKMTECEDACQIVQELDVWVHHGFVERQFAGALASMVCDTIKGVPPGVDTHVSFLMLLMAKRHATSGHPCHCLDTVLQWGACPHVGRYYVVHGTVALVRTPLLKSLYHADWRTLLTKYGCPPYTCFTRSSCGHGLLAGDEPPVLRPHQMQWLRWDRRRGRRTWTMQAVFF
jgi:hypothetical protein